MGHVHDDLAPDPGCPDCNHAALHAENERLRAAIRWLLDETGSSIETLADGTLHLSYASAAYGAPVLERDRPHAVLILEVLGSDKANYEQ